MMAAPLRVDRTGVHSFSWLRILTIYVAWKDKDLGSASYMTAGMLGMAPDIFPNGLIVLLFAVKEGK